jgi:hypothetical protein
MQPIRIHCIILIDLFKIIPKRVHCSTFGSIQTMYSYHLKTIIPKNR